MTGGLQWTTVEDSSADAGSANDFIGLGLVSALQRFPREALGKQRAIFRGLSREVTETAENQFAQVSATNLVLGGLAKPWWPKPWLPADGI